MSKTDSTLMVLQRLPQLSKLRIKCCKGCSDVNLACHLRCGGEFYWAFVKV